MTREQADARLAWLKQRQEILARIRQLDAMIRYLETSRQSRPDITETLCQILPFPLSAKR